MTCIRGPECLDSGPGYFYRSSIHALSSNFKCFCFIYWNFYTPCACSSICVGNMLTFKFQLSTTHTKLFLSFMYLLLFTQVGGQGAISQHSTILKLLSSDLTLESCSYPSNYHQASLNMKIVIVQDYGIMIKILVI